MKRVALGFTAISLLVCGCINPSASQTATQNEIQKNAATEDLKPELLVFGTSHLTSLGDRFSTGLLDTTIDRLTRFNPDIVAIEAPPGWTIAVMALQPETNSEVLGSYASLQHKYGQLAQSELGFDWGTAEDEYNSPGNHCLEEPEESRCILIAVAAYDYYSGLLRWHYLSETEKAVFRNKNLEIAKSFESESTSANEYVSLAIRLAKQLGHDRIYPVDDHIEKAKVSTALTELGEGFDPIQKVWGQLGDDPFLATAKAKEDEAVEAGDLQSWFRWLNAPSTSTADKDLQFGPFAEGRAGHAGMTWNGYWEARNLRMASHISDVLAANPGKRMVYIVGSSHKGYIDGYFTDMDWVRSADSLTVLEPDNPTPF